MPQSIYLKKSLTEELLDRALLLLKKVESQKTEMHRWASGMYSPKAVKKMMKLLEGDDALRSEFPEVQDKIGQHVENKIAQRGLMHPNEINGRVHAEYDDDMRRDRRNVKTVFDPHGGEIKKKKELLDYIKGLTQMIAYQYDLRPDEENSSFSFTFAHRGGQNYEPVTLDDDENRITGRQQAVVEKYDAIVQPITDEDGKSRFVIKTIVNDSKHNPYSVATTPMPPHNHIDLTSQEPTMFSRDPIGDGEFDSKQHWEEGGFRVESDFHQRHPIVNSLPEMPTEDTSGKQQKGIVTGLDDRKGIIQTLKDIEMPHPETKRNMFAFKQVRGDNTALRVDWTGGKHKGAWNNYVDDMHGMIRNAIESVPEEHRESMGEAMFDSFHQSFDGMSPRHFELNRDGMKDVPGYSNSISNHFNDSTYEWMLKALMSMDRSLLLLKSDALREMIENFRPNYQQSKSPSISTEKPLVDLDEEPTRGDKIQDKLMENLVGIKEPRTRRKLRSMGAPIREANPLRGEAGERKPVERRARKEKGRNKGAILQDAIMGKDVPKLVARYPTHFEEDSNKQGIFDLDNMLHTLDSLIERGEFETMSDLLDSVPIEVRMDRAARYAEALETTPWLINRKLMLDQGDGNFDTVDELGVPHDFPFSREIGYHMDQTPMYRLEDTQSLTGTDSFRIPTPRHHESFPYFRRDRSGKFILPLEGLSTSGDDKERPKHLAASRFDDMPRPIWMETIGGGEKPSSEFFEVHPGQEGEEWPHWSEYFQSHEMDGGIDHDSWRDESLGFDETGRGKIVRRKTDPNNPLYRATEERGEPLMPLPRKLTLMPDEEKFEAEFGEHGKGVFTGLPFNVGTGFTTGEPMEIALQLLKERKSPEAFAHKLEYDKKYQKNPKRVKYRVQLNRERRKRGIYGKGGKDVSHTQGNKLTLENPHSNRARHFKNRGTLRRVKVR